MTKKQNTFYGIIGLILGIIGGIAGTAFTMGAERQNIKNSLAINAANIESMQLDNVVHEASVEKEMDRYAEIIAAHITQLQANISTLTTTVGGLRIDVQVLKALMERMENDLRKRSNSD